MPIYEYQCSACGHQEEIIQKMSDSTLTICPKCGKNSFEKMISAPQFQLKGTGWYATDFKTSQPKKESKASAEDSTQNKTENKSPPAKSE